MRKSKWLNKNPIAMWLYNCFYQILWCVLVMSFFIVHISFLSRFVFSFIGLNFSFFSLYLSFFTHTHNVHVSFTRLYFPNKVFDLYFILYWIYYIYVSKGPFLKKNRFWTMCGSQSKEQNLVRWNSIIQEPIELIYEIDINVHVSFDLPCEK